MGRFVVVRRKGIRGTNGWEIEPGLPDVRVFEYELPNLPGQRMTGVLVRDEPGSISSHHHTTKGSVVAHMLEGALRSKVNDGPEKVYRKGDSWIEPPRAPRSGRANVSATEPATLLAVFVAEDGAELTTYDDWRDSRPAFATLIGWTRPNAA